MIKQTIILEQVDGVLLSIVSEGLDATDIEPLRSINANDYNYSETLELFLKYRNMMNILLSDLSITSEQLTTDVSFILSQFELICEKLGGDYLRDKSIIKNKYKEILNSY